MACAIPEPALGPAPPEVRVFHVTPTTIAPGAEATVRWTVSGNIQRMRLTVPDRAPFEVSVETGELRFRPLQSGRARLEVEGFEGQVEAEASFRIGQPEPVTIEDFNVEPRWVRAGEPVRIRWRTKAASQVVVTASSTTAFDVPVLESLPAEGARILRPERSTRFSLRAEGLGGPLREDAVVRVGRPPPEILRFEAQPLQVPLGRPILLRWSLENVEQLRLEDVAGGELRPLLSRSPEGPEERYELFRPAGLHRFLLTVEGEGETRSAQAEALVTEAGPPRIEVFTATPSATGRGGQIRLAWAVANVDSVVLTLGSNRGEVVAPRGEALATLDTSQTAELRASGQTMTTRETLALTVDPERPSVERVGVAPLRSAPGEPVVVSWAIDGADRIRLEDDLGRVRAEDLGLEGFYSLRPAGPLQLRLVAENDRGQTTRSLDLVVGARPTARLSSLDPEVRSGQPARWAFATSNARVALLSTPGRTPETLTSETGTVALRRSTNLIGGEGRLFVSSDLFSVSATAAYRPLPRASGRFEVEPNDSLAVAHVVAASSVFEGRLRHDDVDVLVLQRSPAHRRRFEYLEGPEATLRFFDLDAEGAQLGSTQQLRIVAGMVVEDRLATYDTLAVSLTLAPDVVVPTEESYRFQLDPVPAACGDGVADRNEDCDDGNALAGDGCSAACILEGLGELEPNDARVGATPLVGQLSAYAHEVDEDWFLLEVPATQVGAWQVLLTDLDGAGCSVDLDVALFDAGEREMLFDDGQGLGCARLSGPRMVLTEGSWFIRVRPGPGRTRARRGPYAITPLPPPAAP